MSSNAPGFRPLATAPSRLTERLAAFIPAMLLPDPASAPSTFEGVVLALDVEGFPALADSLVKLGREGAEALGRSLNNYFSPLIETVSREGGQVIGLDGAGMQVFFPTIEPDQLSRTANIALNLLEQAAAFHPVQTAEGRYSFGMRAGIGQGKLDLVQIGTALEGKTIVVQGEAIDQARQAVQQAAWGEASGGSSGSGHIEPSGNSADPNPNLNFGDEDQVSIYTRLAPYMPRGLAQKLKLTPDAPIPVEFRRVVNVFIILPDLDLTSTAGQSTLQDYYTTLQRVCSNLDGRIHQITSNSADKSVSLHLTFGALTSNSEDAENALQATLAVRDMPGPSGALPAISIASGNVFTGSIGTATCQRYTVLGDAVKLSRQLTQAARESGPGVLPVDRYTRERVGLSYIFGPEMAINLPGQAYPVRANPLLARRPQPCSISAYLKETGFFDASESSVTPEDLLAGKERVFVQAEEAGLFLLVQDWVKAGGKGAAGNCLPNAASAVPYLAWSGLLGGLIGLTETDSRTEKAAKLSQAVSLYAPDYAAYSSWLSQLIGLYPEEPGLRAKLAGPQREFFGEIVVALLRGLAQANPLLIVINNLQWSDEAGLDLLEQVARELAGEQVVFGLSVQRGNSAVDARIEALAG